MDDANYVYWQVPLNCCIIHLILRWTTLGSDFLLYEMCRTAYSQSVGIKSIVMKTSSFLFLEVLSYLWQKVGKIQSGYLDYCLSFCTNKWVACFKGGFVLVEFLILQFLNSKFSILLGRMHSFLGCLSTNRHRAQLCVPTADLGL